MVRRFWLGALGVLLAVSLAWGISEYRKAENLTIISENQYRRSLSDFVTHLDGLETNMAKSRAAGTATQQVYYLTQSLHQSDTAVKDLSLLPSANYGLNYIDQFLNQIGDFTGILTQQVAKGTPPDKEQEKTLKEMHERLITVNRDVQELYADLNTEKIAWVNKPSWWKFWGNPNEAAPAAAEGNEGKATQPASIGAGLEQLDVSLQKLPPFSYSGQTETHSVPEPLGLPESTVTEDQARDIASDFLSINGYPGASPEMSGTSKGSFEGYTFKYHTATVDVCKKGGVVTLYRDERDLGLQKLTVDETASQAMNSLKKLGWNNFVVTSTEDFGGYIQLEAVSSENGIRIYPDKIRLTAGRDNGMMIGYDSTPYWLFHHSRPLSKKLTKDQCAAKLRKDLSLKESRLAVISLPGWQEAFCYEFRGTAADEEFLIYINAADGTEEKIQRIIHTPRGEFLQ
ncbi:MAG: Sporulation protein YpeB [Candidatus Dichloromethanomonas elyunquensis]|nr:MAG: Sporulation protein YpeB [Candidatus Dichloromethanomonas elyunquensis]